MISDLWHSFPFDLSLFDSTISSAICDTLDIKKKFSFHRSALWLTLQCSYILNSVLFQTKSNLVWKSDSKNVVTIFQTKPSLVWKLKMLSQISKPNPVWFGNFLCRVCGGNKFQIKSSLVWKFSKPILVWIVNMLQFHIFLNFPMSNLLIKIGKITNSFQFGLKIFNKASETRPM